MGSYPSVGTRPLAARRMVSRCAAHADGSAARRQRYAYPRATTVNRDPSLTSHALDRRPPARAVATAAELLGTALWCLSQLPRARLLGRTRRQHALPQVQRILRYRLGELPSVAPVLKPSILPPPLLSPLLGGVQSYLFS